MTIVEYFQDKDGWTTHNKTNPSWGEIENAVRKMDNNLFPIVQMSCLELSDNETCFDDEDSFNIIGGDGRIALFHQCGDWQYENNDGGDDEVRLWESDQGYFCKEKNVITDIQYALKIIREWQLGYFTLFSFFLPLCLPKLIGYL